MLSIRLIVLTAALFGAGSLPQTARGQEFPSQPIRIVVPYAAGTTSSLLLQKVEQRIKAAGGPQIVLDNKPGGGGSVAATNVIESRPDGYTLMQVDLGTHAINVSLIKDRPFDPLKDFRPITLLWNYPSVLVVPASLPVHSVKELVEYGKKKPGGLNYASQGIGSGGHILGAMLAQAAGAEMTHIPYKGGGPARTDLLAGRVDLLFTNYLGVKNFIDDGKLRVLGVSATRRMSSAPQIPTMGETGYPGVDLDVWFGIMAPAGVKPEVVQKLRDMFVAAVTSPEVTAFAGEQGIDVQTSTPEEFAAILKADIARMAEVVKNTKAEAN
jgi:tripartite-type tricarboxylate transporter receptor subunit TctC